MSKKRPGNSNLPEKANKILNGIVVAFILIAFKVWHLSVVQHEKKLEEASRPQKRVVIERSERASICDRFDVPLAINKVQYNVSLSYGPIRELPRWIWQKNEGRRSKYLFRKEYITKLSHKLAQELHLDAERIEDLIHSKAAILGNVPCLVKEDISEKEYFRLKMLEKDWPGIHAEIAAKRCYPMGPVAGELIGYIGPISRKEYEAVTNEMRLLRKSLAAHEEGEKDTCAPRSSFEEMSARLEELEKIAYHINDFVGKTGVEAAFDEKLRGLTGKHVYLADIRGNFLRELSGSENPQGGTKLKLTISAALQAHAEELLAEYDSSPLSVSPSAQKRRELIPENQPWMKGGAIIAMDPNTGEIYAMASFPRFDPNDFIRTKGESENEKEKLVNRWLESEKYLADVWDMKEPYTRQRLHLLKREYFEEMIEMSWENYLSFILPKKSSVRQVLEEKNRLADGIKIQQLIERLTLLFQPENASIPTAKVIDFLYAAPENTSLGVMLSIQDKEFLTSRYEVVKTEADEVQKELGTFFETLPLNYDKLLLVDLYRLVVEQPPVSAYQMTLSEYRECSGRLASVKEAVCQVVKELFREHDFKIWREEQFHQYLASKRQEEKEAKKKYARPYIEYLDEACKDLFDAFWKAHQWDLITLFLNGHAKLECGGPYLSALNSWAKELHQGAHSGLVFTPHYHRLLDLLSRNTTEHEMKDFLKSLRCFEELQTPLLGKYFGLKGSKQKDLAAAFYPSYGFGFARSHAFRQAATIGSLFKVVPAYEALRQKYLSLKANGETLRDLNPMTIIDDKHRIWGKTETWNVGFTLDGKPIPMYYRGGRLPRSEHAGVGKVDIVRALEASSNPYFALLVGDILEDPEDLCKAANLLGFGEKTGIDLPGEYAGRIPMDVSYNRTGLYAMSIGQHSLIGTPLQAATMLSAVANDGEVLKPQIISQEKPSVRWRLFMPSEIQDILLKGLKQVVMGDKGTARYIRDQFDPKLISQIIGKTSTAEVIEKMGLDGTTGRLKLKHVWFGGISYETQDFSKPELVVIVYLRYGDWGWNAAPLALEIVQKWRSIKAKAIN